MSKLQILFYTFLISTLHLPLNTKFGFTDNYSSIFAKVAYSGTSYENSSNTPVTRLDKEKILKLVNNLRRSGLNCGGSYEQPAAPLVWNEKLEWAARHHSRDMYRNNYLSHDSKDGTPFSIRIKRQHYNYMSCGENIALGYETEEDVMEGWTKSAGHCSNFMNDFYTEIGVARTGNYWVMVLAAPDNFVQ